MCYLGFAFKTYGGMGAVGVVKIKGDEQLVVIDGGITLFSSAFCWKFP